MAAVRLGDIHAWRQGAWQTIFVLALLLCGLTACLKWPDAEVSSKQPDRVLFKAAMSAVEQGRFDVANLTLQTLINTYPDSEYASKAKLALQDPRIAKCGEVWNSPPECNGRLATKLAR
jgi:predicted negative regulator of RcsB-dependent stress response